MNPSDIEKKYLIIGLGNPGEAYRKTRHNVGFDVVQTFAHKQHWTFKRASSFLGDLAQGVLDEAKVLVLQPMTFMNESGTAVRRCVDYYKVPLEQMIVVSDDAALPVGTMRMRTMGSSGGHNGLRSIEMHLNTECYPRLRIGIGNPIQGRMKDYVLGAFSQEERPVIEEVIAKAVHALELWLTAGIVEAMQVANLQKKKPLGDKDNGQTKDTPL